MRWSGACGRSSRDGDVLMVISDHGFTSFRRGVNLNPWLLREGYLTLKPGADGSGEWLRDVDWSRTKAYVLGLTGLFLNLRGREAQGIVAPGADAAAVKAELIDKLRRLCDEEKQATGINEAFDTAAIYTGPIWRTRPTWSSATTPATGSRGTAPRASWPGTVFDDNIKPWSGDHCVDPRLVPGVFFCNRAVEPQEPALIDIAPTALRLFGIEPPAHMDGKPIAGLA